MKKVLIILISMMMCIVLVSCVPFFQEEETVEEEKTYVVGDVQEMDNIKVKVTKVESGLYCDNRKSTNGSWVKVFFTMENLDSEPYYLSYLSFVINDTYTLRNTTYNRTSIPSGDFYLLENNIYNFYCVFDCNYSHHEKDLIFIWESNDLIKRKRQWLI